MKIVRKYIVLLAKIVLPAMLFNMLFSFGAYALSGGPSQPEVEQFAAAGVNNMVDPFSGDFSYNIPLLDVGGYPINLSYQAGISADQEASWVGLGWNVNPGVVTRNMRGLPDDFKHDNVKKEYNMKPNQTFGVVLSPDLEVIGKEFKKVKELLEKNKLSVGPTFTLSYNTYKGVGIGLGLNLGLDMGKSNKSKLNLNMGLSSLDGVSLDPSVSFQHKQSQKDAENGISSRTSIGFGYNSRDGLKSLSVSNSISKTVSRSDKNKNDMGTFQRSMANNSSSISFAAPTYVPTNEWPMININGNVEMKIGTDIYGADGIVGGKAFYSGQMVDGKERNIPAVGYLYAQHANSCTLMDFNREKDGAISNHTTNIAVPTQTQDLFNITGQGVSGMFRAYRSDVGYVGDVATGNFGAGGGIDGLEFGITTSTKGGLDISGNVSTSTVGRWDNDKGLNPAASHFNYQGDVPNTEFEPAYFKLTGEKNADSESSRLLGDKLGGYNARRIAMVSSLGISSNILHSDQYGDHYNGGSPNRSKRQKRNQQVQMLTATEANKSGLDTKIKNHTSFKMVADQNGKYYSDVEQKSRTDKPGHHISQLTVNQADGTRYIYGIPAYNNSQDEVAFALSNQNRSSDFRSGITSYTPGKDDNVNSNKNGNDHYFTRTVMPPFAHSYLLTSIVSADYVDADGVSGPSDGDLGSYTKFNYTKVYEDYKWRAPYQEGKATLSEGVRGNPNDDKGNYVYGTKEVWYLHSVETRTHVAEFYISDRADAFEVKGSEGGRGSRPLKKLDKIALYSKASKVNNTNPEPIKEVNFEYNYSLCPGIPSNVNGEGKLTLKKVFFSFGKNKRNLLNPYEFIYSSNNPSYDMKAVDRWGNYKPNPSTGPSNSEFSFAEQDEAQADLNASAWNLKTIKTPTKGEINVEYESDDYAYVQNRQAMTMMKLTSYEGSNFQESNVFHFKLPYPIDASKYTKAELESKLSSGISNLFFQFKIYCTSPGVPTTQHLLSEQEYLPGYCRLNLNGLSLDNAVGGYYTDGKVTVQTVPVQDNYTGIGNGINPVTKAAMQYARLRMPEYVYNYPGAIGDGADALLSILASAPSMVQSISDFAFGINRRLYTQEAGKIVDIASSWIRLNNPDGFKKGGGHRVKKITISDNWSLLGLGSDATYGQTYEYTKTQNGKVISSGVAAYEPTIGGEENPFRQPIFTEEQRKLVVNNEFYSEEPFGEGMFPGASVGYSKVVVKDIVPADAANRGTGRIEHEFYTAKDFPTFTDRTGIDYQTFKPSQVLKLLSVVSLEYATATQGYYVENNDMHGKQKSQFVYPVGAADDGYISGVQYFYRQAGVSQDYGLTVNPDPTKSAPKRSIIVTKLDNKVTVIDRDRTGGKLIYDATVGVDHDFTIDSRESISDMTSGGINTNLDLLMIPTPIGIIPVPVPLPLSSFGYERTEFHSLSTSKLVQRYGILDNTVAYQQGASVSTQNLAWDAQTGEVLLTKTTNNFDDPIYNFTYPAHWAYPSMGQVAENDKLTFTINSNNKVSTFIAERLLPGDELAVSTGKVWVKSVNKGTGALELWDVNGDLKTISGSATVIRSGHRNQQGVSIGSVVSLSNPLDVSGQRLTFDKVLQASANEYSDEWKTYCECYKDLDPTKPKNSYAIGIKGTFRPLKSYAFLTGRKQTLLNNNTNIRTDGTYASYSDFWTAQATNKYWKPNPNKPWQFTTQVTNYNPMGFEIENKDALNRYSAAQYGFGAALPVAISDNSLYRESGFDSFEDYNSKSCWDRHFDFIEGANQNSTGGNVGSTPTYTNPIPYLPLFDTGNLALNYALIWYRYWYNIFEMPPYKPTASTATKPTVTSGIITPDLRASESHTGKQSIRVLPSQSVEMRRVIVECPK